MRTGQTLADTTQRVTSVAWAADNKTLLLTTEDAVTKRADTLWRHVLGSTAFDPLYSEPDELYSVYLEKTRDEKYLMLGITSKDTTEFRYLPAGEAHKDFAVFYPARRSTATTSIIAKDFSTSGQTGIRPGTS